MSTKSQIQANRRNAQKSTGPRTSEGKTAVSQNAVKHGLTAVQEIISSESQAEFDLHRGRILYKTLLELERLHLVKNVTTQSQTAFNESINYDKVCKTNPIPNRPNEHKGLHNNVL